MVKHLRRFSVVLIAVAIAALLAGYAWLRSGPISNEKLAQMISRALSAQDGSISATVGKATVNWQHLEEFGSIHIARVVLRDRAGNIVANFPDLRASMNPLAWLLGGEKIDELAILRPQFYLEKDSAGIWKLGLNANEQTASLADIADVFLRDDAASNVSIGFRKLLIYGAQLYIADEVAGTMLTSTAATIRAVRTRGAVEVQMRAPLRLDDMKTSTVIIAAVLENGGHNIASDIRVDHLPLALICKFTTCPQHVGAKGTFTGRIAPALMDGQLQEMVVQGVGENISLYLPKWFEEPVVVPSGRIDLVLRDHGRSAELRASEIALADTTIRAKGIMTREKSGIALHGYGETTQPLAIDKLYKYWPITKAPQTRDWVNTMLSKGYSPHGSIHVTIKPGDLDLEALPDSAFRATVEARDMTVEYLKGFPKVRDLDGTVYFTGHTMRVTGTRAAFSKESSLKKLTLHCPDLYHPNVPMKVDFQMDAAAADVQKLLALEHFAFDDSLKLSADIRGRVIGDLSLGFNAFSEVDDGKPHFENVAYDANLALHDIAQKNVAGALDVGVFNGTLAARDGVLDIAGKGTFDGHPMEVTVAQEKEGIRAKIRGTLSVAAIKKIVGDTLRWFSEGTLGMMVEGIYAKQSFHVKNATLDAREAAITIPELSFAKAIGEPGKIQVLPAASGSASDLSLRVDLGKLTARGNVQVDAKSGNIVGLHITKLQAPGNNFSLKYAAQSEGEIVEIAGTALDAREAYAAEDNGILADFPKIKLLLDLDTMLLDEIPFSQLRGELDCLSGPCTHANITAIVGKGNIAARIMNEGGKRRLSIVSGDAGDLLKALDITDRMFEGKMQLGGIYDDTQQPSVLNARLIIENFTLKNSQILARIFSIGSLSGLSNLLTGSGIEFEKLSSDIESSQGVFTLKNGKARGTAMGFTVKGTVDTTSTVLNIKGVLVPAFILNSVVASIPILGELAGGEGEGLIAFNYSVKGKYSDPQTSVNPLSGLTPGFLRGIFTAFDGAEKQQPAKESAPKP